MEELPMHIYTRRVISHEAARKIAQRLINSHFHNPDSAVVSIPANIEMDDDLLIMSYIHQQELKEK